MTNEQSATLLRLNKQAQVAALNAVGFSDVTENSRASEFGQRIKWVEFEEPIKELRLRLLKEQHVFTGVSGTNVLRLLPPLCLGMDEAKEFLERFKKVL